MGWIDLFQINVQLWALVNTLKTILVSVRGMGFMFCGELCDLGWGIVLYVPVPREKNYAVW
jgi:hypothetical protein